MPHAEYKTSDGLENMSDQLWLAPAAAERTQECSISQRVGGYPFKLKWFDVGKHCAAASTYAGRPAIVLSCMHARALRALRVGVRGACGFF